MFERFYPVNCDDRNIVLVFAHQIRIGLDIHLFHSEQVATAGTLNRFFRQIAKVATGFRVNDDVRLG